MTERYETEFGTFTWHPEPRNCPHQNGHACDYEWWEDPL